MLEKTIKFIKNNAVLVIAFIMCVISAFFVPVSREYIGYIDFKVIVLLFTLMSAVAGFEESGVFDLLAKKLIAGDKSLRKLSLILVLLPFFLAMLITNDVALISFVPFTILVFSLIKQEKYLIYTLVLQTVSANLGSMMTPIGNPQNLFLYTHYSLTLSDFVKILLPFAIISLILLCTCTFFIKKDTISVTFTETTQIKAPKKLFLFGAVLTLSMLSVFNLFDYRFLLVITLVLLILFSRNTLKKVDYALLVTFVFFFIFSGNMAKIEAVRTFLAGLLQRNALMTGTFLSQVMSNVPTAVLLSGFTDDFRALLIGTNIGGLGTLIASLASVITFQIYTKSENAKRGKYILVFTCVNAIILLILLLVAFLFN